MPKNGGMRQKGVSQSRDWLTAHAKHRGDACLAWPFGKDRHGYGQVQEAPRSKKIVRAHRVMCELAHGAPASPDLYATHNCGKGHLGCINPKHLEWKTASGNQYDRRTHGTHGGGPGRRQTLGPQQWQEIREAKGKVTQTVLAKRYGVAEGTIRGIQAGRWGTSTGTKFITHRGRSLRISDWAKEIGITQQALRSRLKFMPPAAAIEMRRGSRS